MKLPPRPKQPRGSAIPDPDRVGPALKTGAEGGLQPGSAPTGTDAGPSHKLTVEEVLGDLVSDSIVAPAPLAPFVTAMVPAVASVPTGVTQIAVTCAPSNGKLMTSEIVSLAAAGKIGGAADPAGTAPSGLPVSGISGHHDHAVRRRGNGL